MATTRKFPIGFRFVPTDEELVQYYLQGKVDNTLPDDAVVKTLSLYSDDPWRILNKELALAGYFYLFTKLKIKSKRKIERKAGSGTWKGQSTKRFCDSDGNVLYFKKEFVFEECKNPQDSSSCSSKKDQYGHWLMSEFSLKNQGFDGNYVLCRIWNKYATRKEDPMAMAYMLPNILEKKKRKLSSFSHHHEEKEEDQNSNKRHHEFRENNSTSIPSYQSLMAESVPPLLEFSQVPQPMAEQALLNYPMADDDLFYCTDFATLPALEYGVSEVNYNSSEPFSVTPLFSDLDAQTTSSIDAALAKFLWPEQDTSTVPTTTTTTATGPSYPSSER